MATFEEQLNELLERTKSIKAPVNAAPIGTSMSDYNHPSDVWANDVEIFYNKYLKNTHLEIELNPYFFTEQLAHIRNLLAVWKA